MKLYKVKLLTTRNSRTFSMIASCRLSSYIVPSMRLMYGWYHSWNSFTIQIHYTNRLPFPSYNDVTLINGPTSFTPSTTFKYQPFLKFITRCLQCFMELLSELIDSESSVNIDDLSIFDIRWAERLRLIMAYCQLFIIRDRETAASNCPHLCRKDVSSVVLLMSPLCIYQVIAVCPVSVSALVSNLFRWALNVSLVQESIVISFFQSSHRYANGTSSPGLTV